MSATHARMLPSGSVIGILGGGQLGRMLALAAARLGYRCHIFTPEVGAPAAQVTDRCTIAAYDDSEALARFAATVDVVTYEFENIPLAAAELVGRLTPVHPSPRVLAICQDRIAEKRFLNGIGAPVAAFRSVASADDLSIALDDVGRPAVLKLARLGYDGKGQFMVRQQTAAEAWQGIAPGDPGTAPLMVLERWIDFTMELSVIVARTVGGETAAYVPVENIHANHILKRTIAPAPLPEALAEDAVILARRIADALQLVGLLAVEMFLTRDGQLVVNELAPRPHNSGHWTIDACVVSQFEQCVRAITGLPLGDAARHADAVMENLIGDEIERWVDLVGDPAAHVHIYGKHEARPGRKMGHVTWLKPRG